MDHGFRFPPRCCLPVAAGFPRYAFKASLPTGSLAPENTVLTNPSALRSSIRCSVLLDRKEVGMTALVRWLLVRRPVAVATGTLLGVVLGLWVAALSPGSAYAACPSGVSCCGSLPSLFSFTTSSSGCGTNPPGNVSPAQCVQGTNNGTACASDANCTGGGVCRGHLDCTGLYFGGGQPAGVNLPATVPDRGLSFSKVTSCSGCPATNPVLSSSTAADVPAGCPTPAGTPTYGMRHCTSPGCLFGAPLAIPNPANTATG